MAKTETDTLTLEQLAQVEGGRYGVNRPPRNGTMPKRGRK